MPLVIGKALTGHNAVKPHRLQQQQEIPNSSPSQSSDPKFKSNRLAEFNKTPHSIPKTAASNPTNTPPSTKPNLLASPVETADAPLLVELVPAALPVELEPALELIELVPATVLVVDTDAGVPGEAVDDGEEVSH